MVNRLLNYIFENKRRLAIFLLLFLVSFLPHAINMFHFPYYENDEGTYMSQAWAIINKGKLAPYTYWYDHAPFGWIMIAGWTLITGGFFSFGTAINSGRVFMLLIHIISTYLIYFISKKITKSSFPALIATIIFSLSPLAIFYQRRVLLDNMMIFLVLLSLAILYKDKLNLQHVIVSAIIFGLSVLTKENAVFFFPAFVYAVATKSHKDHRIHAVVNFIFISALVISFYPLYALIKHELFPPGVLRDGDHVSLISTLQVQFSRGADLPFWIQGSDFRENIKHWVIKDVFFLVLACATTIVSCILSIKIKHLRIPTIFVILFWLFLFKSKLILDFYITPVIPLIALNFSLIMHYLLEVVGKVSVDVKKLMRFSFTFALLFLFVDNNIGQYSFDETKSQTEAIKWVRENVDFNETILIDSYAYLDLRRDGGFQNAEWYFKALLDPEVQTKMGGKTLPQARYILMSHNMINDFIVFQPNNIVPLFEKSELVKLWKPTHNTYVDFDNYLSTYGDWASLHKILTEDETVLTKTWNFYRVNFIGSDGRSFDPEIGYATTSEAQSYAMLRAVWMNDQDTFDKVWKWTRVNLQKGNGLFYWYWQERDDSYLPDVKTDSATDADSDIALALLFASKMWGGTYLSEGKIIIDSIWKNEVKEINGRNYLLAGDWAKDNDNAIINPSYLSPYAYRIFSEVDERHDWNSLVDTSYEVLDKCSSAILDKPTSANIVPDWCEINQNNEAETPNVANQNPTNTSYDAFRSYWRIALDYQWFGEDRAYNFLNSSEFILSQWRNDKIIYDSYSHDGLGSSSNESIAAYSSYLALFSIIDKGSANQIFQQKIVLELRDDPAGGYWSDPKNYYTQNWVWFGSALYTGNLQNLWSNSKYN